jgi:AmmeMemoRadiSam system protein B
MGRVRQPVAYGFYPPGKNALEESIKSSFLNSFGTGEVPKVNETRVGSIIAGVAPHAGYMHSGPIATHIYSALAKDGFPATFIIIGPKHGFARFEGAGLMISGNWMTPFGDLPIDTSLAKAIHKSGQEISPSCVTESEEAHQQEHSIEVQLPFIQFLAKEQTVQFVPVIMSTMRFSVCQKVGAAIANAIQETRKDVTIIASTDFTHYGRSYYNYAPVGSGPLDKVVKWVYETDAELISTIEALNGEALLKTVTSKQRTMCGSNAVAVAIEAAKNLGAKAGTLLKYATSYDVSGGPDAIVGYASIAINK